MPSRQFSSFVEGLAHFAGILQSGSFKHAGGHTGAGAHGGGHAGLHTGGHAGTGAQGGGQTGLHAGGHTGAGAQGGGHTGLHAGGQTGGHAGLHTGFGHAGAHGCSQIGSSGQQLLLPEHPDQKNAIELNMSVVARIPSFLYIQDS